MSEQKVNLSTSFEFDENSVITITDEYMEKEDEEDYKKLIKDSIILKETMDDVNKLLEDSGMALDHVEEKVEETQETVKDANTQLAKANKYQKSIGIIKGTLVGTIVGLIFGGPIGGLVGWEIGTGITVAALTGSICGGVSAGGITYGTMKGNKDKAEKEYRKIRNGE